MARFGSKQIEETSKTLVKQILGNNLIEANKTLAKLVALEQESREKFIENSLISEADDFNTVLSTSPAIDNIAGEAGEADDEEDTGSEDDKNAEVPEIGDDEDAGGEAPEGEEDLETGENLGEDDETDDIIGNAKADEMSNVFADLNFKLNKAKINLLYNKITTLKSKLNALNLDADDMKYVELDATLSFYSEALENLQQKSIPGIEGAEQTDIVEKIEIINKALKTLASEIDQGSIEDASDKITSSDEAEEGGEDEIDGDNGDIGADEEGGEEPEESGEEEPEEPEEGGEEPEEGGEEEK